MMPGEFFLFKKPRGQQKLATVLLHYAAAATYYYLA
jgi:hypothetical protein